MLPPESLHRRLGTGPLSNAPKPENRSHPIASTLLLTALFAFPTAVVGQTTATWVGGASGNWSDASKWSTNPQFPQNGLPGALDLYDASFAVNVTVTLTEAVTIERLTSTAALTLSGAFPLSLNNGFHLDSASARTVAGSTVILLGGTSEYSGAGNLVFISGAVLNNHAVLDWQSDAGISYGGGTAGQFNNLAGATFRKSAGAGTTLISSGITFNNSGTIDIDSGQLDLNGGTFNLNDGSAFTGSGLTRAVGGLFTLSGSLSANNNFDIAGGFLAGTHTLGGGTWGLSSGGFTGAGTTTIASDSKLALSGSGAKSFTNVRTVNAEGTLEFGGTANVTLTSASVLQAASGGLIDIQTDADIVYGGGSASTVQVQSGGTARKSSGAGVTQVGSGVAFNNAGTVQVQSGTLQLAGGGSSSGAFEIASGAAFDYSGGTHVLENGAAFSGAGVARVSGATLSVAAGATASAVHFDQTGGTLFGTGTLNVSGNSTWSGGTQGGAGKTEFQPGSTTQLTGLGIKSISERIVDNRGTLAIVGEGNVSMISAGVLDNRGLLDIQSNADFVYGGGSTSTFHNRAGATLRKSAGDGVSAIGSSITFHNSGIIDIDSGELSLAGGAYNLNDGSTFTGSQFTKAVSGTFALNGNLTANNNFEVAGATIGGTHTLNGGTWKWTSGTFFNGATTVPDGSTLALEGSSPKSLSGQTLNNQGTLSIADLGNVSFISGSTVNNSALVDVGSDADFVYGGGTASTINNTAPGTLRKSGGAGTTSIGSGITLNNSGTIDIDSGVLDLTGGAYNLNDGTVFSGSSPTRAVSGIFNLSGTLTADNNFEIAGASISGTHTLAGGSWKWTSGALSGSGTTTVAPGSTLAMEGASTKTFSGHSLDNQGTVTFKDSGNVSLISAAVLNNNSLFDVQSDADFGYGGGNASQINNTGTGTFVKSGGPDVTSFSSGVSFNNAGLVAAQAGTLQFTAGNYTDSGGTLRVENNATISFSIAPTFASARIEGNGTILAPTVNATGATIAPGLSAGELIIDGNLNLGALATISIEIGGTTPGSAHDLLTVDGTVAANGNLQVALIGDFVPSAGMSFTVLDSTATISGAFANVASGDRLTLAGGSSFLVQYGLGAAFPDRVILSNFAPVPEPKDWMTFGGAGLLAWAAARRLRRNRQA
ncbi:MAG: beta strand repeat-containing protein [Limisphaerales bacterium]